MTVYILELVFVLIMGMLLYCKKISKKNFLTVTFILFALVLGLRGSQVGEDTAHYIDVFEGCNAISWRAVFTSGTEVIYESTGGIDRFMETGYIALNKLIRLFTGNAQWLIFIVACITCYLMAKFIYDNCTDMFFATYIYLCESLYMQSFNLMRQMLALAIGLQAYTVLKKHDDLRGYMKAIMYIVVACLFHKSAIVLLALIPLWMIKNMQRALKYVIAGSVAFSFSMPILSRMISIFIPRYSSYLTTNYWESNIGGTAVLWLIEIIMCFFIYYERIQEDKQTFITVSSTAIYIALELVGLQIVIFTRITLYFRSFLLFLFPYFTKHFRPRSDLRIVYKLGMMLLLSILFMSYASTPVRMYQFFWQ